MGTPHLVVAQQSDPPLGSRVRITLASLIESPELGLRFVGNGASTEARILSEDSETVTVQTASGHRLTIPRPGATVIGTIGQRDDAVITLQTNRRELMIPTTSIAKLDISA